MARFETRLKEVGSLAVNYVVAFSRGSQVYCGSASGESRAVPLVINEAPACQTLRWREDGRLLIGVNANQLKLMDIETEDVQTIQLSSEPIQSVLFSRDSTRLAVVWAVNRHLQFSVSSLEDTENRQFSLSTTARQVEFSSELNTAALLFEGELAFLDLASGLEETFVVSLGSFQELELAPYADAAGDRSGEPAQPLRS